LVEFLNCFLGDGAENTPIKIVDADKNTKFFGTIAEFFDSAVYEELKDFTVQKVNLTTPTSMLGLFIVI
jgi:hypothetical protein